MASPPASSAITISVPAKPTGAAPSFYANPFSGAVLHEHHDEHDHDLVPGMSSITLGHARGNGGDDDDAQSPRRRASEAVGGGWGRDELSTRTQEPAQRPRKVSFGWSGFMGSGRPHVAPVSPPARHTTDLPPAAARNTTTTTDSPAPPSILVRHHEAARTTSPPSGVTTIPQEDKYKSLNGQNVPPVSVTVQQVSLGSPVPTAREESTITKGSIPRSVASGTTTTTGTGTGKAPSSSGLLGARRGRRGSEAGVGGGKKRSVSPMSEHLLRGGPGQF